MDLPPPVRAYFEADAKDDAEAFAAVFAPDAVVHDEGEPRRGAAAIRAWRQAAKDRYRHRAEPLDATEAEGRVVVRTRVSGDFPGSPAVLTFAFRLTGGRIAELEIR